jgi:hypothetical protein
LCNIRKISNDDLGAYMDKKRIIIALLVLALISGCSVNQTITKKDQAVALNAANMFMLCMIQNKLEIVWDKYLLEEAKQGSSLKRFEDEYNVTRTKYGGIKKATLDYIRVLNLPNKGVQLVYKLEFGNREQGSFDLVMEVDKTGQYKAFNMNGQTKIYGNFQKIYSDKPVVITGNGINR